MAGDRLGEPAAVVRVVDVTGDGGHVGEPLCRRPEFAVAARVHDERPAAFGKRVGHGAAKSLGRPCDQCDGHDISSMFRMYVILIVEVNLKSSTIWTRLWTALTCTALTCTAPTC